MLANEAYTRHEVTYPSGDVTVSGVLLRPRGRGPFPAVVLNHGYIEPSIYVTGQGLMREQDYLARAGFVVLHTDYRGHAGSDPASDRSRETRLGYTRDTINAVQAVKKERYVDPDRVAMLGRSMGGGVTYNALVAKPGLVKAAVVFAPVSSDFVDNFNRWTVAERPDAAAATYRRYGTPQQEPEFYRGLSARTYFDRITEPVLIHHGTLDDSCPIAWSRDDPAAAAASRRGLAPRGLPRASSTRSGRSGRCRWSGPCGSCGASCAADDARRGPVPVARWARGLPWRQSHLGASMSGPRNELHTRRVDAVRAWTSFVEHGDGAEGLVRPEILRSWERSAPAVGIDVAEAPLADESDTASFWNGSPLQVAVERVESELRRTAEDGDLVVAVTDPETRILWTYGGRVMRRKAETVNFVAGGRGTTPASAPTRSTSPPATTAPSMVFSAEHYAPDRAQLGVLGGARARPGVRRAARRHRPLHHLGPDPPDRAGHRAGDGPADRDRDAGLAAAPEPARGPDARLVAGLDLTLLGAAEAHLDGTRLFLNRRQTEILALLALNPAGLSLEHLHALLYGDQAVTFSTLKAEVSHLRSALHGQLASRPYRLTMPVPHRRQRGAAAAAQRPGARRRRGVRRRPDARHRVARARSSSPTTWPSRCARRCSPTRSRRRWPATPSSRRTTPR